MSNNKSLFYQRINPFQLAGAIAGFVALMDVILLLSDGDGFKKNIWTFNVSSLLLFALFNSILSFSNGNKNYFLYSVISYISLAAFVILSAVFLTGISLDDAWSVRWLLGVVTFAYVMIFTIVNIIKKIVELAKKHENKLRSHK